MTQSPYGSDPSHAAPREPSHEGSEQGHEQGAEQGREQGREQAPPTEQVPVQPPAGSGGFARPTTGSSYGVGDPEPSSSSTASWATGSYGSPSAQSSTNPTGPISPIPSGPSGPSARTGYGSPSGTAYGSGSPYGDPYAGPTGAPTPPWGGQPAPWPGTPGGPGQPGSPGAPGFLANLFDTSFDRFVTPVVAKVAYLVVIVAVGLTWVARVVGALVTDPPYGLVVLVVGGVIALVTVIGARVLIEAVLALVRLAEDTRAIREKVEGGSSS